MTNTALEESPDTEAEKEYIPEHLRIVSVGFVKPLETNLDDDTIYVQLSKKQDNIYATAISNIDFTFFDYDINGNEIERRGNLTDNKSLIGSDYYVQPYEKFVTMLSQNNKGVIQYRFRKDGLKLTEMLEEKKKIINKMKDITGKF